MNPIDIAQLGLLIWLAARAAYLDVQHHRQQRMAKSGTQKIRTGHEALANEVVAEAQRRLAENINRYRYPFGNDQDVI